MVADNVELPGVDVDDAQAPFAPQIIEIDDLDTPAPEPTTIELPIKVETPELEETPTIQVEPAPVVQQVTTPTEATGLRRSS